ncbi:antitoxin [Candidatus Brocadia pituitae]|nr:antitoxin [Candidatus Brocadia pituitae]
MDKRISIDPKVCHGQACIKGTRTPVHQIIRMMVNSNTIEKLLEEYSSISRDDILACLEYVVSTAKKN